LVAAALAAFMLFWPVPRQLPRDPRVVLIGVDGATWDRIDPLVAAGRLPNFARLMDRGHRAWLESLTPQFSPRVWSTVATGCPPEIHGIWGFSQRKSEFRVGTLWDQLKLEGRSFGLCDYYFTWPPDPGIAERDFIIPSRLAPDDTTHPPEYRFYREITEAARQRERRGRHLRPVILALQGLQAWQHGIRLSTLRVILADLVAGRLWGRHELDRIWRDRRVSAALEADLFCELIRRRHPEFAVALFTQTDQVSHRYWKYLEPEAFGDVSAGDHRRYGNAIDEVYCEVDRGLGKILSVVSRETDVLIVSDHGFQANTTTIAGRYCRIRTERLIDELGLADRVFGTSLDLDVFLQPTVPSAAERESLLVYMEGVLNQARLVGEEEPIFTVTREAEAICLSQTPRTVLPERAQILLAGGTCAYDELVRVRREARWSGRHKLHGVYLLAGPSVARATGADTLDVLDVAPTLAELLDLPRSPLWTGREALTPTGRERPVAEYLPPAARAAPEPLTPEVSDELREKLRSIGYLE
jgi:arylsulfatase A-like enzyme